MKINGSPEHVAAMFAALAKAQKAFKAPKRTKTVQVRSAKGNYDFDYAPLEEVQAATHPALNENGLFIGQYLGTDGDLSVLMTLIAHESGAYIESSYPLPSYNSMQELGSLLTYLRRYTESSAVGVAPEDDDDGTAGTAAYSGPKKDAKDQKAPGRPSAATKPSSPPQKETPPASATEPNRPTPSELEELRSFMVANGFETQDQRAELYKTLLNKLPSAFTKEDLAMVKTAVEAKSVLGGKLQGVK